MLDMDGDMNIIESRIKQQKQINGLPFPLVLRPADVEKLNRTQTLEWARQNQNWLREKLVAHGAILVRGLPLEKPEDFEELIDEAGFPRMPYVGGAAPRNQVTEGRVLTTNESPPSEPIPFHHEMAQVPNPPAYIFFYCQFPPATGGETSIVHSHLVYKRFYEANSDFADKIERTGVKYIRIMPEQDDTSSAIGRSWKSTFLTDNPVDAEKKMKELGTDWEWLENGNLKTITATVPAIRTDERTGMKTFFNSAVAAYTGWVDSRNDPTKAVICGDGSPVDGQTLLQTAAAMEEECVNFPWQKGDVLFIDNKLVMHSRRPFEGRREILATISPK